MEFPVWIAHPHRSYSSAFSPHLSPRLFLSKHNRSLFPENYSWPALAFQGIIIIIIIIEYFLKDVNPLRSPLQRSPDLGLHNAKVLFLLPPLSYETRSSLCWHRTPAIVFSERSNRGFKMQTKKKGWMWGSSCCLAGCLACLEPSYGGHGGAKICSVLKQTCYQSSEQMWRLKTTPGQKSLWPGLIHEIRQPGLTAWNGCLFTIVCNLCISIGSLFSVCLWGVQWDM